MTQWARHNTTLPFTRLLAGPADYTPVLFGERRRETSWAHQVASAAVLTSPLLVYAAHPQSLLTNPAVEMIKSIPSVWDETIVLPPSEIGELAAFARRSGDRWFLAVLNGPEARTLRLPLSFLGDGNYRALSIGDRDDDPAAVKREDATVAKDGAIDVRLRAGGGLIARFDRAR
jgi:alpha-glucosidase